MVSLLLSGTKQVPIKFINNRSDTGVYIFQFDQITGWGKKMIERG